MNYLAMVQLKTTSRGRILGRAVIYTLLPTQYTSIVALRVVVRNVVDVLRVNKNQQSWNTIMYFVVFPSLSLPPTVDLFFC